jgi:hypothetical protein
VSTETQPALTPEEWARWREGETFFGGMNARRERGGIMVEQDSDDEVWVNDENRAALAALALHGQPFGFTWEDVDAIRTTATYLHDGGEDQLHAIADRIEALLPPREP